MNNKKKILLCGIILIIVDILIITVIGRTYTFKEDRTRYEIQENQTEFEVKFEKENIAKVIKKELTNNEVIVKIKGLKEGKTVIFINDTIDVIYVHPLGIITVNSYLGFFNGGKIIPISFLIFFSYTFYLLLKTYKKNKKENMYQYKNVAYLGILIFLSFAIITEFFNIFKKISLADLANDYLYSSGGFSILLLPISLITFILVTISNIKLIIKEGKTPRNLLGLFLGLFIIVMTLLPEFLYNTLLKLNFVNLYNLSSIWPYLMSFVESSITITVAYLECVLIATIIFGLKSAKRIPDYNKDYIIILGCKIGKNGSLPPLLKSRVDRAIEFAKMQKEATNKDIIFVPSGGKGSDEDMSEGDAMKKYLLEQGIKENKILVENKSKNTHQNIKYSLELIKKEKEDAKVAYSTTNYHVFRAGLLAHELGYNLEGIGSKTKSYYWINAFIREFAGTLYSEKKKHITVITILFLIGLIMALIMYFGRI